MSDALAGVVGGGDQPERGAVVDAEALAIEAVRSPAAPTEAAACPRRGAVEVRDLLDAFERLELLRETRGRFDVSVDGEFDALGLRREPEREIREPEAGKSSISTWPGGSGEDPRVCFMLLAPGRIVESHA